MKWTYDRHYNIMQIDFDNLDKNTQEVFMERRHIWDTKEQAEKEIVNYKPMRVDT